MQNISFLWKGRKNRYYSQNTKFGFIKPYLWSYKRNRSWIITGIKSILADYDKNRCYNHKLYDRSNFNTISCITTKKKNDIETWNKLYHDLLTWHLAYGNTIRIKPVSDLFIWRTGLYIISSWNQTGIAADWPNRSILFKPYHAWSHQAFLIIGSKEKSHILSQIHTYTYITRGKKRSICWNYDGIRNPNHMQ